MFCKTNIGETGKQTDPTWNRYVVVVFYIVIVVWVVHACATVSIPKDPNEPAFFFEGDSDQTDAGPTDPTRLDPIPSAISF